MASDWPHLRGPTYDGVSAETGLLDRWPSDGPLVLWSADLGHGYSGFAAHAGRVFTQMQTLYGQYLVCLDAETGQEIWRTWYDWPFEGAGMYPGPRATPTYHQGRIYFAGPRGEVLCAAADDGELIWTVNLYKRFKAPEMGFGYACSPLVESGKVILPLGGRGTSVVALNAADGSTAWTSGDEPGSYCSALPITLAGQRYVVTFLQNALASFDLDTGRLMWQHRYSQGYDEHAAFPLYREPLLLISSPFRGGSMLYRLDAEVDSDASEIGVAAILERQSEVLSNDTASSVLVGEHVFGFDLKDVQAKPHRPSRGEFRCLEFENGKVLWSTDKTGHATVVHADGKLLMLNDRGEFIVARDSPERYEEIGRAQVFTDEICWTPPALHEGKIYLRSPSRATCLYLGQAADLPANRSRTAIPVNQLPQPRGWTLSWLAGGEREYPLDPPSKRELRTWYVYSLAGVFGVAAGLAIAVWTPLAWRRNQRAPRAFRATLLAASFAMGIVATPWLNYVSAEYVFCWPATLLVSLEMAFIASLAARRRPQCRRARRRARLAGLLLLATAAVYFHACLAWGLAIQWFYLIGLPLASPITVPAAYLMSRSTRPWSDLLLILTAYSGYYWISALFALWKMSPAI
jgi:outer membrane protein assembly factor BamB